MKLTNVICLIVLCTMIGCAKSSNPIGTQPAQTSGRYGYTVNGQSFRSADNPLASSGTAELYPKNYGGVQSSTRLLSLTFQSVQFPGPYTQLFFEIPIVNPGPGSFAIGPLADGTSAFARLSVDTISYESHVGGTITITSFDTVQNLISGTFSFTASETSPIVDPSKSLTITSGYFNNVGLTLGAFGQGALTASVNGVPFNSSSDSGNSVAGVVTAGVQAINIVAAAPSSLGVQEFQIGINAPQAGVTYDIGSTSILRSATVTYTNSDYLNSASNVSAVSTDGTGSLTITKYDATNRRISATFAFTAPDKSTGLSYVVSNGVINDVQWAVGKAHESDRKRHQ